MPRKDPKKDGNTEHQRRELTRHWTDSIVDEILKTKKPPFVITGGLTTSGPTHLGTVCEFLYPAVLHEKLLDLGHKSEFHFIGDILDAFDSIPLDLEKYSNELNPYLGVPLVRVPDPMRCHKSIGEHYLSDAQDIMKKMRLKVNVIPINETYDSGKFDPFARLFLEREYDAKKIVAETSFRKVEEMKDWSPIMPICGKCGKIATTRVTWHDSDSYEYIDDVDVGYTKGCGYKGKAKIGDHEYKLQWRLHWPTWQVIFNTSAEGGGKDHFTKGGSYDTEVMVHRVIFERDPPVPFKFGFILFDGKKYSKSKGTGMGARDLIKLIPPEVIEYMLVEPDLPQDKDIKPSGDSLMLVYDEIERISATKNPESRADKKRALAFNLVIKRLRWRAKFVDILTYYQIHRNWKKVGELLDDKDGVEYLAPYIEEWLARKYAPERYNFALNPHKAKRKELVNSFNEKLKENMDALEVHNLVYSVAEENKVKPDELFQELYHVLIGKPSGPRFGKLVLAIGTRKTREIFDSSLK